MNEMCVRRVSVYDIREIHVLVDATDVLVQVLPDSRELPTTDTDHSKLVNLTQSAKVKTC